MEFQTFKDFAAKFNISQHSLPILLVEQISATGTQEAVFKTGPASRETSLLTVSGRQLGTRPVENAMALSFHQFERFIHTGVSVGRAKTNKICLPDNAVSKMHATFKLNHKNEWVVVDVESENKTRVNGKFIEANKPVVLNNGDGISFADIYHCTFFLPAGFKAYLNSVR